MIWAATFANFFFPGLGYLLIGHKRGLAVGWLLGVIGLTIVEQGIKQPTPDLYMLMFASVFVMNTMFAIDAYQIVKARPKQPSARAASPT